jgi:hypothetical protein
MGVVNLIQVNDRAMSEIDLSTAFLRYEEPFMYLILKDHIQLDPAKIREISNTASELSQGKPYLLLSDARAQLAITPEGQGAAADKDILQLVSASAILVSSWPKKLLVNMVIHFSNMPFPMKMFTHAGEALNWLDAQRKLLRVS